MATTSCKAPKSVVFGPTMGHVYWGGGLDGSLADVPSAPQSAGGYDAFIMHLAN